MTPLEVSVQQFTLPGCREVLERMGNPPYIAHAIQLLEEAVYRAPNSTFDLAKALIESTCKTILVDRGLTVDIAWELPRLLKETLSAIPLVPPEYEGKAEDILRRIAGSLQFTVQNLGELRNKEGLFGHGQSAYVQQLESVQAIFAARSAESVIHLLYMCHVGERQRNQESENADGIIDLVQYPDLDSSIPDDQLVRLKEGTVVAAGLLREFNQSLDDQHDLAILGSPYRASEALYYVDNEAYRDALAGYLSEQQSEEAPE